MKITRIESQIVQEGEFYGDLLRLRIILSNLVSNAIKYQNPEADSHRVKITVVAGEHNVMNALADIFGRYAPGGASG